MLTRRSMVTGSLLSAGALVLGSRSAAPQTAEDFVPPPSPAVAPFQKRLPIPRLHLPLKSEEKS